VKLYNARRGYVHTTLTRSELTTEFVNFPYVEADANAEPRVFASFRSPVGSPRLEAL
jgi:alkaline phosphatase D